MASEVIASCATFAAHEFARKLVEAGRHPQRGGFCRYAMTCRRCGFVASETQWIGLPSDRASLARLAAELTREEESSGRDYRTH